MEEINNQNENKEKKEVHANGAHVLYLSVVGVIFAALVVIFLFFPRSRYSELEKRDLAEFPHPKNLVVDPSKYTDDVSFWFSDTEPYRDIFMTMSMGLRDAFRVRFGNDEESFSFKPALATDEETGGELEAGEAQGNPLADENAKVANAGILVVGSGPKVRALMAFGGTEKSMIPYKDVIGDYKKAFPNVNLYAVVIPNATEFYLPKKAEKASKSQKIPLDWLRDNLDPSVKYVDVHSHLAAHTNEDIYLRTDHHWAPLGAYYAARALASVAGVPFKDLTQYDQHVVHNYVGSMYGYSKDIAVKNAPEDFVYWTPKNAGEKTTYTTYTIDKDYQVTGMSAPHPGQFFIHYNDGAGGAYCTFMGGDTHTVKVETNNKNGRRIIIIKDSFGNPIPSFLFYSFEEVHVIDFRYFKKNMKDYVRDNKITDIALAFNTFSACTPSSMDKVRKFLTQPNGVQKVEKKEESPKKESKSAKETKESAEPAISETSEPANPEPKPSQEPTESPTS